MIRATGSGPPGAASPASGDTHRVEHDCAEAYQRGRIVDVGAAAKPGPTLAELGINDVRVLARFSPLTAIPLYKLLRRHAVNIHRPQRTQIPLYMIWDRHWTVMDQSPLALDKPNRR
jgi:hypothetical protein